MASDQVDKDFVAPVVPVVEISPGHRSRQAWDSGDERYEDDEDFEDIDDDDHEDESAQSPRRSARSPPLPQPRYKSVNGKKRVDMTPPDQKLETSQKLAKRFASEGKVDKAIQEYIKCTGYSHIIHGTTHWKYAQNVINLGEAYMDLKNYHAQAEYHAETARSIMLLGGNTASSMEEKAELYAVLIKIYRVLGQAQTVLKKLSEAEQSLVKADKISQERSNLSCVTDRECDLLDISLFLAMARLYAKQKKYALASAKYDKVIELMEKEYGTDSSEVMKVYTEYGKLEQSKGRHANHDKTIQMFLQAHSIASAIHKDAHPQLVDTALALSQAYANTGWEEAEGSALSYLEECLTTCTTIKGPTHPKTLEVQDHLAKMLIRTDKANEAMDLLRSSLPAKCETFGDYSEPVSDTYKLMGSIFLSEGNIEKALRNYKKCYTIEEILLGKRHRKTKDTLKTMELLMANPSVSQKFVLNKEDELKKRPRFNGVVARSKQK